MNSSKRYLSGSIDVSEKTPDGVLYSVAPDLSVRELDRGVVFTITGLGIKGVPETRFSG